MGFANNMPRQNAFSHRIKDIFKIRAGMRRTISSAGGQNNADFSLFLFQSMEGKKQKPPLPRLKPPLNH
jgi:hypothetical protein